MKKSLQLLMIGCFLSGILSGQQPAISKSNYAGLLLRNNGWGIGVSQYSFLQPKLNKTIEIDLVTHRHAKEVKIINANARDPKAYVFGKLNKVGQLRFNLGINKPLSFMDENGNVGIGLTLSTGFSAVFLKPVYLDIYYPSSNGEGVLIPERYNPNDHVNQQDIIGYSSSRYGWGELKVNPGLNMKTSLDLNWGAYANATKLFRIGSLIEYFPTGLPIMAFTDNPKMYFTLFVSLSFGKETDI